MSATVNEAKGEWRCRCQPEPGFDMSVNTRAIKRCNACGMDRPSPKPSHYKIVCISMYTDDIARVDSMVRELKKRGLHKASRSMVIRVALEALNIDIMKPPKT